MASRPDRLLHIEQQLAAAGIVATRIEAVTPRDFPPELEARRRAGTVSLNAGELACGRSHQKIWRHMVENDIDAALILEDDVVLSAEVRTIIADPSLLDHGQDAIQLETRQTSALVGRPFPTAAAEVTQHRLMSSSLGTAAYVITARFARQLLARDDLDEWAVDGLLFGRQGGVFYRSRIFQAVPAVAIQLDQLPDEAGVGKSDLDGQRPPHRRVGPMPLGLRVRRTANHWRHHLRTLWTFGVSGDLWGSTHLRLPVASDLKPLLQPATSRSA